MNPCHTVTLDVREDIRNGREPFSQIMATVAALRPDEQLQLIAPFEPVPLFAVMAKRGFHHQAQPLPSGDWEVHFTRDQKYQERGSSDPLLQATLRGGSDDPRSKPPCIFDLDARGLEPPQPLITILEAVATLAPGAALRARTDRRPIHLYAQLEERGFTGESEAQEDGSYVTTIQAR